MLTPVHGAGEGRKGERDIPSVALYQRRERTSGPIPPAVRRVESQGPRAGRNWQRQRYRFSAEVKENDEVLIVFPVPHEKNFFLLVSQDPHALLVKQSDSAKLLSQPCHLAMKQINPVCIFGTSGLWASRAKKRNKGRKKECRTGEFEFFQRFAGFLHRTDR